MAATPSSKEDQEDIEKLEKALKEKGEENLTEEQTSQLLKLR